MKRIESRMNREEAYRKSNSIYGVELNRLSKKEYADLLKGGDIQTRERKAQRLIDYLCDRYGIERCVVKVSDRCQPHSTRGTGSIREKTLGYYRPGNMRIVVFNTTSIQKKEISITAFASTLIHEFCHHYDLRYLGLSYSLHTAGFYRRISDLESKLR